MLTSRITCSVLNCELEHCGILHDHSLNEEDSRSEKICPCLRTLSEEPVDDRRVINVNVANSLALIQIRQDRSIDSLGLEEAVMNRRGRDFVGIGSLQRDASVSEASNGRAGSRTNGFTRKDNIGHAAKSREAACSSTSLEKTFLETIMAFTSNLPGTKSGPENFMVVVYDSVYVVWFE